jgi:signal transduction histidine kinase
VPLIAQDEVIGALEVVNQRYDDEFDSDDVTILSLFATQAAIAIQNARLMADKQASLIELNRLEQRKSQFIALVSHELRTPLNLVSGYQVVLRENLKDAFGTYPDALDSLDHLEQATARLTSLITNITSMYNLETGRTQLMLEERDLVEIVEKVLREHRQWIQTKGLVISFAPVTRPLCAICDALEVTRILDNLLSNAVKFTPEGGKITVSMMPVEARVRGAESTVKGPFIQVAITDTGPGIDPLQLESIFQRFAQVDNHLNRLQGGMGLGLPLAKALVEKHGGELWVYTARGRGSTFYFTLPAVGGI